MSLKAQVTAILERFADNFTAVPVKHHNFTSVSSATAVISNPDLLPEWVDFQVMPTITRQMDINAQYWKRTEGLITATVWVRADTGIVRAYEIADLITAIFARARFDDVIGGHETVNDLGEIDGYYGVSISIPYSAYATGT